MIKRGGHLRTLEKCRKHSPVAPVFYISLAFSNARRVLSKCNTRLRLLYLLNKSERVSVMENKTKQNKAAVEVPVLRTLLSVFCCLLPLYYYCYFTFSRRNEIVSMFWTTVLLPLNCHVLTNIVWVIEGKIINRENDQKGNKHFFELERGSN